MSRFLTKKPNLKCIATIWSLSQFILVVSRRVKISGYCWMLCSTMCPTLHWDDVRKICIFSQLWNELWEASFPQAELLNQLFWLIHCCPARKHRCFGFKFVLNASRLHWPSLPHTLQNLNSKSPICWEIAEEFNHLLFSKNRSKEIYNAQTAVNICHGQGKFLSEWVVSVI